MKMALRSLSKIGRVAFPVLIAVSTMGAGVSASSMPFISCSAIEREAVSRSLETCQAIAEPPRVHWNTLAFPGTVGSWTISLYLPGTRPLKLLGQQKCLVSSDGALCTGPNGDRRWMSGAGTHVMYSVGLVEQHTYLDLKIPVIVRFEVGTFNEDTPFSGVVHFLLTPTD